MSSLTKLVLIVLVAGILARDGEGTPLAEQQRNTTELSVPDPDNNANSPTLDLLRGRDGRDGLPGPPGSEGKDGKDGRNGRDGAKGEKGEHGPSGLLGPLGEKGERGERGETGLRGDLGPRGDPGPQGLMGPAGPPGPSTGGVVYTRWGRTTCPDTPGTQLIYSGRAGGTHYNEKGGGANHLPEEPQYLRYKSGRQYSSVAYMHGAEYKVYEDTPLSLSGLANHNVPCAVCHVRTREAVLMIPARTTCPPSWTLEYNGYLMTEYTRHHRSTFECVDKDPESIPGSAGNSGGTNGALFYHVEGTCNGIPCPPYVNGWELTCSVCTM